jgi:hypothetical protein
MQSSLLEVTSRLCRRGGHRRTCVSADQDCGQQHGSVNRERDRLRPQGCPTSRQRTIPDGPSEIFADGFGGPVKLRDKAEDRPSGLAVGADARFMYPTMYVDARLTRHDVLLLIALRSRDRRTLHATECAYSSTKPAGKSRSVGASL